jgi:hypothetical protein
MSELTVRFQVSYITRDGLRQLLVPAQGRRMFITLEGAEAWLGTFLVNNTRERLQSIYGEAAIGTFRVDAWECWSHGDPKGIFVDEEFSATYCGRT